MKYLLFVFFVFMSAFSNYVFSQNDDNQIELTKEQWTTIRDQYAVMAIKLLAKLDTLNNKIDSIKSLIPVREKEIEKCENEIYSLVGTTKDEIVDYRKKFEETENRIKSKNGAPADARMTYFDDISTGNIKCLPEFSSRYLSMKIKLEEWEGKRGTEFVRTEAPVQEKRYSFEGTYVVKKRDNLWKISEIEYNTPGFWNIIWEANKNGVVNKDYFYNEKNKFLTDPNYIYPGQILKIPSIKEDSK